MAIAKTAWTCCFLSEHPEREGHSFVDDTGFHAADSESHYYKGPLRPGLLLR